MEEFVRAISRYPCLWNTTSKDYRDAMKKEKAWMQVISAIKNKEIRDVKTAKAEWKKLRDSHRDSLKRTKTRDDGEVINIWKYADLMQFLLPYMKTRKVGLIARRDSDDEEDQLQDENSSSSHITDQEDTSRKRKIEAVDIQYVEVKKEMEYNRCVSEVLVEPQTVIASATSLATEKHPLDSFFESMCTTTKQFPAWLQNSVKRKIFTAVSEAEDIFENYNNQA